MNAARWLGWLLPRAEREFVLGDLDELYGGGNRLRYALDLLRSAAILHAAQRRAAHRVSMQPAPFSKRGRFMSTLLTDLRYAFRTLARNPSFSFLALLTLVIGIGATTAIYSVVVPVLFQPLPYPGAERIVAIGERNDDGSEGNVGYLTFRDIEQTTTSFEAVAATSSWQPTLQGQSEPERLTGQRVTRGFFSVFGVRPAVGRDFTAEENVRGQHRVAILSHGLWVRRFGGDPSVIGKPVSMDGIQYIVVGVMPHGFQNLMSPQSEIWAPLGYEASLSWACRTCRHLRSVARIKEGTPLSQARQELSVVFGRIKAENTNDYAAGSGMVINPMQKRVTAAVRPALLVLLGAVGFVLLIACANVSGLLLGRAMQREGEFAIRGALGAGRWRVARQLLTESVLLSVIGAAGGVLVAWWAVRAIVAYGPPSLPRLQAIGINWGVLAFTAGLAVVAGIAFGLVPAVAAARPDLFSALRPGGRLTGQRSRRAARAGLVVIEMALALMLLAGAGLLMRSLHKLLAVDPGFDANHLLTMEVQTTGSRYGEDAPVRAFFDQAREAVLAVPGVVQAGWTSQLPLGGNFDGYGIQIEGRVLANPEDAPGADRYAVSPGYLEAMGIPLKRGRIIAREDATSAPPVVLINEAFAKLSWPGEDPIGKRIQMGGPDTPWRAIVGIVGDVRHTGLDAEISPQVYVPAVQWPWADGSMVLAARTTGNPEALLASVRGAIRGIDRDLPIIGAATMDEVIAQTATQRRFAFLVFQLFALVALLLAAAGVYGVLAGSVAERTREIGIRSALGASRSGVLRMVLSQGLRLTAAGMVLGGIGALLLSRFLEGMLFGVGTRDPVTLIGVAAVLVVTGLLACLAPALRAVRVSPLEALRGE
ncbi:MAG: ABC transporter permease [Gemmatimonadales bacterium]|nr:ABC transporter permease [Gemmatimonadales bacterium]